jgi:hypothetical protein
MLITNTGEKLKHNLRKDFRWVKHKDFWLSFVSGDGALFLYEELKRVIKKGIWYDTSTGTMEGSHVFAAVGLDSLLKKYYGPSVGMINLRDLHRSEVVKMLRQEETFYSDIPEIIIRGLDEDPSNERVSKDILSKVKRIKGKIKKPVLIKGLDIQASSKNKYGLVFVPGRDLKVVYDEKLSGKYDSCSFNNLDEKELPMFSKEATYRIWCAKPDGISGIYFDRNIFSNSTNLYESNKRGRLLVKGLPKN